MKSSLAATYCGIPYTPNVLICTYCAVVDGMSATHVDSYADSFMYSKHMENLVAKK
jgi:hypothetical protein